jgi:hypothetical protein
MKGQKKEFLYGKKIKVETHYYWTPEQAFQLPREAVGVRASAQRRRQEAQISGG